MRSILKIAIFGFISWTLYQLFSAWQVLSKSEFTFKNLESIDTIFTNDQQIKLDIYNKTRFNLNIKNVIVNIEKNGIRQGGFNPTDIYIKHGINRVALTFTQNTKYLKIAGDYISGDLDNYKISFRGTWLGLIPVKYSAKLKDLLEQNN